MKINIANASTGQQKTIEIDDDHKTKVMYEKRISHEFPADNFGDEFKGYVLRITGGEDKQGFSMKQGDAEIPGLTDKIIPRRLGPKRANKIRALFNLDKEDDVTKYVIRRNLEANDKHKARSKAPKIQRLITPVRIQRKRSQKAAARSRAERAIEADAQYKKVLAARSKMLRAKKDSERSRRQSQASSN